jgi:sulfur-carrier protein adenylyltransferase/sulfurtransferase
MYLAAAGVGTLGLVDFDVVDASNLQRQILHDTGGMGRPKVESARDRLEAINPNVTVEMHHVRLTAANALDILGRYDVVLDGADNFPTRYLVNDACVLLGRPNAFGAIFRFEGQASVFAAKNGPCYRCLFAEPPPPGLVPSCAEAGVFGVLPGIVGTIQATETIKLILGIGETLVGRLLVYDAMRMAFRELKVSKDPDCPVCGTQPTVRELIDYEAFCGLKPVEEPPAEPAAPAAPGAVDPIITVDELKARWDRGDRPFLLDVREHIEFQLVRLEGGVLIPLGELVARQQELDPDREIVVYCHHGNRSGKATAYLRHNGFPHARNLRGGIEEWAVRIDPSLPRY